MLLMLAGGCIKSEIGNFYMLSSYTKNSVYRGQEYLEKVSTLPLFSSYILDIHPWVAVDSFYPQSYL